MTILDVINGLETEKPVTAESVRALNPEVFDAAFPGVHPQFRPCGELVLVQIRTPKMKSKGGIIFIDDIKDTEKWNTQVGIVLAVGPVAFKNRTTLEPWPEGQWVQPGDFVRIPKHGGDKWEVATDKEGEPALFAFFKDSEMLGHSLTNPLDVKAYIA
jgi:co-chaperonin GroES (HSP10)